MYQPDFMFSDMTPKVPRRDDRRLGHQRVQRQMQHWNISLPELLVTPAVRIVASDIRLEAKTVNMDGDLRYVVFNSAKIQFSNHQQNRNGPSFAHCH